MHRCTKHQNSESVRSARFFSFDLESFRNRKSSFQSTINPERDPEKFSESKTVTAFANRKRSGVG